MQKLLYICLLFSALTLVENRPPNLPQGNEWWITGKSAILKSGNFDETVSKDRYTVVEIITPQSEESQKGKDEWDKFAEMYMGANKKRQDVHVAIINGWQFPAISHQYGVREFPTVLLFTGGSTDYKAKYTEELNAQAINAWVEEVISTTEAEKAAATANNDNQGQASDQGIAQASDSGTNQEPQGDQGQQQEVVDNGNQQQQQDEQQQDENQQPPPQDQDPEPVQQPPQDQDPPVQQEQQQQEQQQQQQQQQKQQQQQTPPPPQQQQQRPPPQQQQRLPQQQQQQRVENNNAAADDSKREVKVVLNTTLLQSQFEALQQHLDAVTLNLKENINDNVRKIDELRQLLATQKQDMNLVQQTLRGQATKFDELKQVLTSNKQEVQQSVTSHTDKHLEEVKGALHQIKGKVFEQKPQESSGIGGGILFLLLGGLVGGGIMFMCLNMGKSKQKRKLLID